MAKYAVINVNTNEWEFESKSLHEAQVRLYDLRSGGAKCCLIKVVIDEDEDTPPSIFDA